MSPPLGAGLDVKVVLFGATGMIGQGVLRECLLDPDVEKVLGVGRRASEEKHDKLDNLVVPDLTDYAAVADRLAGWDACFFCLGVSSAGMSEADYRKVTYDIAVAAGRALAEKSPQMTFIFVSGAGTNAASKTMWARVKGEAEQAILAMPFARKYAFRPAIVRPMHGITSRTTAYRVLYAVGRPLFPLVNAAFPKHVTTTEKVGRAMLNVARNGAPKAILENDDINAAAC
jgi:uncharacterized protein YbjT (DUF2867 family)